MILLPVNIFDDGLLFCASCNIVVDHLQKSVLDKHLEAESHKWNAEKTLCVWSVGADSRTKKTRHTTEIKLNWTFWAKIFIAITQYKENQFSSLLS